jgi:hypothetical protein
MKFPSEKEIIAVCDYGDVIEIQTPTLNFNVRLKDLSESEKKVVRRLKT